MSEMSAPVPDQAIAAASNDPSTEEQLQAHSLQCDECGKLLKDNAAAQWHAEKSGHAAFSESVQQIVPLTDEEKQAKLAALREKLAQKRAVQAAEDAENTKRNAAIERKKTQETAQIQEELKRKEEMKAIEKTKREKREDADAKKKILAQIAQDKAERAARAAGQTVPQRAPVVPTSAREPAPATKQADLSVSKLQIRVAGMKPIVKSYPPETTLRQVAEDLSAKTGIDASVAKFRMFPQQLVLDKTLAEQKLVPSGSLQLS